MKQILLVSLLFVMVGCAPSTQLPRQAIADNQSMIPQTQATVDNIIKQPETEVVPTRAVKGLIYESFEGATQIYYMKENFSDRVRLGIVNKINGAPVWSPDSKKVAFISEGCLYVTDFGTDNITKLAAAARNPVWSPDSRQIAYILDGARTRGTRWNVFYQDSLYVIDADGTNSNIVAEKQMLFSPKWSPNGRKLVFIGEAGGGKIVESDFFGNSDIFIINADGHGITNVTNTLDASEKDPCWSPDGQYIAFLSNNADGSGPSNDSWNLYVMRSDGTEIRKLNEDSTVWTGYAGQSRNYQNTIGYGSLESVFDRTSEMYGPFITWSPDGKYITVCTVRAMGPYPAGRNGPVAQYPTISIEPSRFPIGSLIVFDAQAGKEITAVAAAKRSACWSSDSKRICYIPPSGTQATDRLVGYRQIMARNLIIMEPDGGDPQTIYDIGADGYLDWRP